MALGGARPKPAAVRVIDGSHRAYHGDADEASQGAADTAEAFGGLRAPKGLKAHAKKAWERYIAPAFWLDASREPSALAFVNLWQEFMSDPDGFPSSRHTAMRGYMADLGLTDERNRKVPGAKKKDASAKYF